jgi:hypothetical protein
MQQQEHELASTPMEPGGPEEEEREPSCWYIFDLHIIRVPYPR